MLLHHVVSAKLVQTKTNRGFSKPFAKQMVMEFLIYLLIRVLVISVRYLCLMKNVLCNFVWFTKIKSNVHLLYSFIHVFIHNHKVFLVKVLPNLCQRRLEKPLMNIYRLKT